MTERIMSETTVEYPRLRLRESEIMKIAGHRAHSVGTAICFIFVAVMMLFAFLAWVRDVQIWGNVDTFYFVYWFSFTAVTGFMSYKISFHVARVAEIDRRWLAIPAGHTHFVARKYLQRRQRCNARHIERLKQVVHAIDDAQKYHCAAIEPRIRVRLSDFRVHIEPQQIVLKLDLLTIV